MGHVQPIDSLPKRFLNLEHLLPGSAQDPHFQVHDLAGESQAQPEARGLAKLKPEGLQVELDDLIYYSGLPRARVHLPL